MKNGLQKVRVHSAYGGGHCCHLSFGWHKEWGRCHRYKESAMFIDGDDFYENAHLRNKSA